MPLDFRDAAKNTAMGIAVSALFLEPYVVGHGGSPSRYLLPDLAIVAIFAWRFRTRGIQLLGLAVSAKHIVLALITLVLGTLLAQQVISHVSALRGIEVIEGHHLFSLSQVLHQELVLRAIMLGALRPWFKSDLTLAVIAATVFAGAHPLYNLWVDGPLLPSIAVATIFFFGVATNLLFLHFHHIAFSFSAHAAWNLARFGDGYIMTETPSRYVSEAQSMVEIEGSSFTLGAVLAFLVFVALVLQRLRARANENTG